MTMPCPCRGARVARPPATAAALAPEGGQDERIASARTRVVHHQRRPFFGHHSMERSFAAVRAHLPAHLEAVVAIAPATSKGLVPRLRSAVAARAWRGDVHHVTGDTTFLGLLLPRRRTVLTIHDCEILDRVGWLKGLVYRLFWLQLPCLRAAIVTVISPATREHLLASVWLRPRDVRVVPAPLLDGFAERPAPGNDPPVVLQVGTRPNKGAEETIRAVAGTGWHLLVVGELEPHQKSVIESLDVACECLGDVDDDDVAGAYAQADVLCFPSSREGFGMPVVEAQAVGCPVVAADRPPLPWVAGEGGAVLVDPSDPDAIRAGIAVALDPSTQAALVESGRANVERFRAARVAAQYAAIYDELASGGGARKGPAALALGARALAARARGRRRS